jgi:hypothetical protein
MVEQKKLIELENTVCEKCFKENIYIGSSEYDDY